MEKNMKTLIVEDDFTSRVLLQEILKEYGPAHIAVNGVEAVDAMGISLEAGEPYDLICMDILMPEMNGHSALREVRMLEEIRGIAPSKRTKIIMTTAVGSVKDVMAAYHGMCDAYLVKPIAKAKLLQELQNLGII
jgi:two-component system, chemotaxis family, chemotaxis protein CheY